MSQPSAAVRLREARPRRRTDVPAIPRSRHFSEDDITGALKVTPLSGGLLALGGLSLVGSPPFNIFLSEIIILWAALEQLTQGASGLVIVATVVFIASITCVFGGLISHLAKILLDRAPETLNTAVLTDKFSRVWPLAILFALIVVFGITIPTIGPLNVPRIIHQSACIVQGENGPC
jgi:hydrogenase-4 component F